ncbi:MAG: hypothetical protein HYR84_12690 [Planctomycetes bacterium]|nr:hypothetical protein [Planctomycetota bacterium]
MAQLVSTTATPSPSTGPCPRCQQPLIDPNGLGWCKACGYCRSLEESDQKHLPEPEAQATAPNTLSATGSALGETPKWFWITLVGIGVVAGITFAIGQWLPLTPLQRALFTTIQIGAGLLMLFIGQFIALIMIASDETTLTFKDAVFPFHLYGLVFKRLPSTRITVFFAAWGIAAIVAAAVFIGGLGHWFTYIPGNQKGPAKQGQSVQLPR